MTTLSTTLVNTGLTPNDGTGADLRTAFTTTNNNISAIQAFLDNNPEFTQANVLTLNATTANVNLLEANTANVINLNVSGNISGNVTSADVLAGTLEVTGTSITYGDAIFAGNSTGITGNLTVSKNVQITGNLRVLGNVVTISTSEYLVEHPTIELGRIAGATLTNNDGNDLGIEFVWYSTDGTPQERKGFFGFDNSSEKFMFIPRATWAPVDGGNVEVFSGNLGTALFNTVEANVLSSGTSTFNTINTTSITANTGITGTLLTASQPNITSVGTLANLTVSGGNVAVTNGNINITGPTGTTLRINGVQVSTVDANFTGGSVPGNASFDANTASTSTSTGTIVISGSGGLGVGGNIYVGGSINVSTFSATSLGGTLTTAAQPNITSVGTLANLTVTNPISGSVTGSAATVTSASQPNITSVGTLSSLTVTNDIVGSITGTAAKVAVAADNTTNATYYPLIANITSGNALVKTDNGFTYNPSTGVLTSTNFTGSLTGNASGSAATVTAAAQPNITSLGTLSSLTVVGTTTFGGNVTAGSTWPIGSTGSRFGTIYATGADISGTGTFGSLTVTNPISGSVTGSAATVTLTADDTTNATYYPLFSSAATGSVSPRTDTGYTYNPNTGTLTATIFNGVATTAQYADLAENYESDFPYEPGTVVVFGGTKEVTTTDVKANVSVAGVVSTAPAYLMNKDATNAVAVALRGKVPVKVIGPVKKGELLITSSIPGVAESAILEGSYGVAIFAKSLEENLDPGIKTIFAVII